ncbi:MAG: hypothetical protein AB7N80_15550 [Bdellovibrionales bacterium]
MIYFATIAVIFLVGSMVMGYVFMGIILFSTTVIAVYGFARELGRQLFDESELRFRDHAHHYLETIPKAEAEFKAELAA